MPKEYEDTFPIPAPPDDPEIYTIWVNIQDPSTHTWAPKGPYTHKSCVEAIMGGHFSGPIRITTEVELKLEVL